VQIYLDDINQALLDQIKCRVILAHTIKHPSDIDKLTKLDAECDLFILDGAIPGSGESIDIEIPTNFNYPFLLAGGMNIDNLDKLKQHPMCIGIDMASGIEVDKIPNTLLINKIKEKITLL
jgi:phosphoribosylanthranilate isomerase